MDNEEVGGAIEGDDLALELLPQGGLRGDHHADRELLAASLHAAAAARCSVLDARWVEAERGIRRETMRTADCSGRTQTHAADERHVTEWSSTPSRWAYGPGPIVTRWPSSPADQRTDDDDWGSCRAIGIGCSEVGELYCSHRLTKRSLYNLQQGHRSN